MSTPRKFLALVGVLMTLLAAAPLAAEVAVPYLSGRVVDLAELISPAAEQRIDVELQALETQKGAQLAVLTIPTLDGEAIESFALRVVEAWKLGQEKHDNGVLLLIVRDDRKMRIEVGYGLEGALPDVIAKRILAERLTPHFQAGDFDGGVAVAVDTIGAVVRGEPDALPSAPRARVSMNLLIWVVFGFFILLGSIGPAIQSKKFSWGIYGGVAAPAFLLPALVGSLGWGLFGLLGWLAMFPLLRLLNPLLPKGFWQGSGDWRGGGGGGWSSGGGGGWSGGGGGGFSGGGGSFGGGGASGSW